MGIRSWLGSWDTMGPPPPGSAAAVCAEPDMAALAAVRDERRVRRALAQLGAPHERVLRAAYTPLPPAWPAGLDGLGALRGVMCVLGSADALRTWVAARATGTPQERGHAKRELALAAAAADRAVELATEAFEAAYRDQLRAERAGELDLYRRSLGL